MVPNPFILAADNGPALLPLLQENPELASKQDEHGYSLVHAAASYNHLDLLRQLITEFKVDVNLKDEDGETALFVCETADAAKVLVEEFGADITIRGTEGKTARESLEAEADFPAVVAFLKGVEDARGITTTAGSMPNSNPEGFPAPPPGMSLTVGTMNESSDEAYPEFRRRIEEMAGRDDFNTPEGQADLRKFVKDVLGQGLDGQDRNVRRRHD